MAPKAPKDKSSSSTNIHVWMRHVSERNKPIPYREIAIHNFHEIGAAVDKSTISGTNKNL